MPDFELNEIQKALNRLSVKGKYDHRAQLVDDIGLIAGLVRELDTYEGRSAIKSAILGLGDSVESNKRRAAVRSWNLASDDSRYWSRRLLTSVALGNAAGVIGLGAFIANAQDVEVASSMVSIPFVTFFIGAVVSAFVPLAMQRTAAMKMEAAEAILDGHSEYARGARSESSSSASLIWGVLATYAVIAALFCFGLGATSVAYRVSQFAAGAPQVEAPIETAPTQ